MAQAPALHGDLHILLFLVGLNIVASLMPVSIYGYSRVTIGYVVTLSIIMIFGGPGVVVLAPLAGLASGISRRRLDSRIIANASLYTVVYSTAAAAYGLFAEINPATVSLGMIPGAAAATLISFGLSGFLLSVPFYVTGDESLSSLWERHSWLVPHYVAMGVVGMALSASYIALGLVGVIAFLTPALMMRLSMKQYVDKTADNVEKLRGQNTALRSANVEIRRVSDELRTSYDDTLEALVNALDARDQETKGHSIRASSYMMDIARELGVKDGTEEWLDMQRGSLLHDVGKIGVSDTILLKPGKLDDDEWTLMRKHPEIGHAMLRDVKFLQGPAEIILAHHERWDGKGYPYGLREGDIPLGARIFTVVDTFDSMTSNRPYRKAKSTLEAMNDILRCGGPQFDPSVVEAFLEIYETWVKERERLHEETEHMRVAA